MSHSPEHAEERIQVLDAITKAGDSFIEVVTIIAEARSEDEAVATLREKLDISATGAQAVMEMQFRRLMPGQRDRVREQLEDLRNR